jgi:predicted aldo/keto reductase-like oxidoreductase
MLDRDEGALTLQRRKFGKLDFDVSLLGFGCMRLPTVAEPDPDSPVGKIDYAKAVEMVRYAVDHGVDYIDTAYSYHDEKSEVFLGLALQDGYRERVKLATKLPMWKVTCREDCDRFLAEQLTRLQTDHVDMYLLHSLGKDFWRTVKECNVLEFLDQAKADGRIKYAGFSFHDDLSLFKEIVDAYDWDFCQIQFNYMDEHYQAGVEGLRYAAEKGLAVVIMEPLRGGKLAKGLPAQVQSLWEGRGGSAAHWAFRWVCNFPEVTVVLSGMGTMDEVKENIATMSEAAPNSLTEEELALFKQAQAFFLERTKVKCTDCRYCLPCPQGVAIPEVFAIWNNAVIYDRPDEGRWHYRNLLEKNKAADQCAACGQCESVCPQNLAIIELLQEAHAALV